jgi:hypothetical protein
LKKETNINKYSSNVRFQILTAEIMKMRAFCDIALWIRHPDDGGSTHLWNVCLLQRDYLRKLSTSSNVVGKTANKVFLMKTV